MVKLFLPRECPQWMHVVAQGIERLIQSAGDPGKVVTYSGSVPSNAALLLVSASAAPVTVTLPAASGQANRTLRIKKTDGTANAVTIDANASETIDGALTQTLTAQWQVLSLTCDGSAWHLI